MKYIISRASSFLDNSDPKVSGAYLFPVHKLMRSQSFKCPEFISEKCNNIKQENGYWIGENKESEDVWVVDINSLEELTSFIATVGKDVIIGKKNNAEGLMGIIIYDDYIE